LTSQQLARFNTNWGCYARLYRRRTT
jgi:hypothetical protein